MAGNLVIVAIPDENDRVWKVSSEKVPHLTILFLGDSDRVTNLDQIMQFVEHASSRSLNRFYLPVDHRGELGADKADVLFFKKGRYDFKAVKDFRDLLLKDPNIRTAYDSTSQFEAPTAVGQPGQPWIPHLTLGYPGSPAKKIPDDQLSSFFDVSFNKIAVWTGDFEGPEWVLKDYWDEMDELGIMDMPMDVAMSALRHLSEEPWSNFTKADYTVEQWHAACLIHTHDGAPTSKSECKLPVKTPDGALNRNGVHAAAAALAGARGGLKGVSVDQKTKAANALKRYYSQLEEEPPESLAAHSMADEFILEHFGVKGMKWGVRKEEVHPDIAHVPKKTRKEAAADAEEFTRAKLFYGEGAGTRRKLIKAKVEAKKKKDELYTKAFDHFVEQTDLAKRASQARKERKRTDRKKSTKKTAKGVGHVLRGNSQYANTAAVVGVGAAGYLLRRQQMQQGENLTEEDSMKQTADLGVEFLEHYGIKGMRWGHRKDTQVTVNGKTKMVTAKKGEKLDKKWTREQASAATWVKVHNGASEHFNAHIGALNNKPEYKNLNLLKEPNSELSKKYMNDVHNLSKEGLEKSVNKLVPSPTGKHKVVVVHGKEHGEWGLAFDDNVKHAADPDVFLVKAKLDDQGKVVSIEFLEDEMAQSVDLSEEPLEHFGVKGMKWGVRKEDIGGAARSVGRAAKSAGGKVGKAAKGTHTFIKDVQFESRTDVKPGETSSKAREMVIDAARKPFREEDLPAVKARHGDYGKLTNRAKKPFSKEARAYRKDARETYIKRLESTANSMTNASGNRQYTIRERSIDAPAQGGALPTSKHFWEVSARDVKHAAEDEFTTLELIINSEGYIVDLKQVENSMAQTADLGAEFLAHYGIKGMRWGVRKASDVGSEVHTDTGVFRRQTKVKTTGGEGHEAHDDAVKVAVATQKLKKSGTAALSNQELRDVANRIQLEEQVKGLMTSRGRKFVRRQVEQQGQQGVQVGVRAGAKKAAPVVFKKAKKGAATAATVAALGI